MKKVYLTCLALLFTLGAFAQGNYSPTVKAEKLDRGLVAVKTDKGVFLSWRSLIDDPKDLTFDVYRGDTKLNDTPIKSGTNFTDPNGTTGVAYTVKAIQNDVELETSAPVEAWDTPYMKVHLDRPAGGTSPAGGSKQQRDYVYTPDDVSVADVDGDGQWELVVKWFPTNQADNGDQFRFTGNTILDCYKLDGTKLWRIDLGQNIRSGNHYTQFLVYDFDGDGKAELICKTAPGTIDGKGKAVLMGNDKVTDDYRKKTESNAGIVNSGPEYLTVFNGETGAEINTIAYNPPRSIQNNSGWGDSNANRSDRYLACVAYLDGRKPSAVMCRGYYTYAYVWAVDFDGSKLTEKWFYSSPKSKELYGQGTHSITVGDVDADGCDEIIFGSAALDHNGKFMYRTGGGHGDALHLAKMLPDREGLQVMMPHEEKSNPYDVSVRDAKTGEVIYFEKQTGGDVGRGLAANVSSTYPGYEWWSSTGNVWGGQEIVSGAKRPSVNFRVYWDGDLLDELLDGTTISKPTNALSSVNTVLELGKYSNAASCNSTKATPNLQADIFGDWREEIILHDGSTESDLLIFTTTIPSSYKIPCLMQDRQYRLAVAWQNCAYNQPPHLSFCPEDYFNTKGVISVSSGSLNQVIYQGDEIQPIIFRVKNATGVTSSEMPDGLVLNFDSTTLQGSITGELQEIGEYTFTLTTTGAEDDDNTSVEINIIVLEPSKVELIAYFPFDEIDAVGSTEEKSKGIGNTITNNVASQKAVQAKSNGAYAGTYKEAEVTGGKVGNALRLFGSSVFVQDAYEEFDINDNSFSVEFWMNSSSKADAYLLLYGSIATPTGNWFGFEHKNGDTFRFSIDDDVTKTEVGISDASTRVFDGNWHHIAAVRDFDAKTLAFYIDGELAESKADVMTGPIVCPGEKLVIGGTNTYNFDDSYNGLLDDLYIYKGALSSSKIKADYEANAASVNSIFATGNSRFTVVNAMSGIVVCSAIGENRFDIMDSLDPGVYIIVIENGSKVENYKFIKR
ncbi:MAG: Por secretion system protein [Muribaculaceae bacterium]|nr:Por secretion system protein [Muribaculaceae bacterium]